MYKNGNKSIFLLKVCRKLQQKEYFQMNESCFYVHKLAGIVLLINKQETNNKIEDKGNNFNSRFKFDSETDSQFVRNCFDRLTKY